MSEKSNTQMPCLQLISRARHTLAHSASGNYINSYRQRAEMSEKLGQLARHFKNLDVPTLPLHRAAIDNDMRQLATCLAQQECGVDAVDAFGYCALHYAASSGSVDVADTLLRSRGDPSCRNLNGETPLHLAAECGHVDVVKLLLAAGGKVNSVQSRGSTSIHLAISKSNSIDTMPVILMLIEAGADMNVKNAAGYTPYAMAQDWGSDEVQALITTMGCAQR